MKLKLYTGIPAYFSGSMLKNKKWQYAKNNTSEVLVLFTCNYWSTLRTDKKKIWLVSDILPSQRHSVWICWKHFIRYNRSLLLILLWAYTTLTSLPWKQRDKEVCVHTNKRTCMHARQLLTDNRADGGFEASSAPVQQGCIDNIDSQCGQVSKADKRNNNIQEEKKLHRQSCTHCLWKYFQPTSDLL